MVYALILFLAWLLTADVVLIIPFYAARHRGKTSNKILRVLCMVLAVTPALFFAVIGGSVLFGIGHSGPYFVRIALYLLSWLVCVSALSIFFVIRPDFLQAIRPLNARNVAVFLLGFAAFYGLCIVEAQNYIASLNAEKKRLYATYPAEIGKLNFKEMPSGNGAFASRYLFKEADISAEVNDLARAAILNLNAIRNEQVRQVLEKHDGIIKELMRLFDKPEWVIVEAASNLQFVAAKKAVNLLLLYSLRNHDEKRYQAAAEALRACRNISAHLRLGSYGLIGQHVATQVDESIFGAVRAMVFNDAKQAAVLMPLVQGDGEWIFRGIRKARIDERIGMIDFVLPKLHEDNEVFVVFFYKLIELDVKSSFKEQMALIGSQIARGQWDVSGFKHAEDGISEKLILGFAYAFVFAQQFEHIAESATMHEAETVLVALMQFKNDMGYYPNTLQELVPDYLPRPSKAYITGVNIILEKSENDGAILSVTGFSDGKHDKRWLLPMARQ